MKFPVVFYFQDKLAFSGIEKNNDTNNMNVQYPVPDYFHIEDNCYNYSDVYSDNSIQSEIITSALV